MTIEALEVDIFSLDLDEELILRYLSISMLSRLIAFFKFFIRALLELIKAHCAINLSVYAELIRFLLCLGISLVAIRPSRLDFENEVTQRLLLVVDQVFICLLILQVIYE